MKRLVKEVVPPQKGQSDVMIGAFIGAISILGTIVVMCSVAALVSREERVKVVKEEKVFNVLHTCADGYYLDLSSPDSELTCKLPKVEVTWSLSGGNGLTSINLVDYTDQR